MLTRDHRTRVALLAAALTILPALACGQAFSWYIDDGPDGLYTWTDTTLAPFWEWMGPAAFADTVCTWTDLPVQPEVMAYWACTDPQNYDYSGYGFWADLYLSNNYPDHSNPVTVTLGTGICGQEGSFAVVAGPITLSLVDFDPELDCGFLYRFDFGVIQSLVLTGESLIIKIEYTGENFDGHVFWDADCCPSALHCEEGTAVRAATFSAVKALY